MKQRILEHLKLNPKESYDLRELVRVLRLDRLEAKEALASLVNEGKIAALNRHSYALPGVKKKARPGAVEGKIQVHPSGFGFVIPDDPSKTDLYIPKTELAGAWHGDRVRAVPKPVARGGRAAGRVLEVIERASQVVIGRLIFYKGFAWLKPDDPRFPQVKLKPEGLFGLEAGARIVAQVHFPVAKKGAAEPYATLTRFLGQGEGPEVEAEAVIAKYQLKDVFEPETLAEAGRLSSPISASERQGRRDFRSLRVFTVDGADAKDFDDAIHIERLPNGRYRVGIHIADVSHYVQEGSALDLEAYQRSTSVYLPGRVLPMLPEILSNGVCSLVPQQERLVLSVVVELDAEGSVLNYHFHQGTIQSCARLTYNQVQAFVEGLPLPKDMAFLEDDLRELVRLTRVLKSARVARGALNFDFTEVKVVADEGQIHLVPIREHDARSLIEELMLLANQTVARHLSEREIPALYRVHEDPSQDQYRKLVAALGRLGYLLPGGEPTPQALQDVLKKAQGRPEAPVVSSLLLRSLKLARYAAENLGHFGLAAEHYLHFTSPIRRYPDLVVHRVIKTLLARKLTPKKLADWSEKFPRMAEHTSDRERKAEAAERELSKYYHCLWALAHVGEPFEGLVSGVSASGVFVALPNGVEGLVRLADLKDDHYSYQEELLSLTGARSKKQIRIGDSFPVRIARVNLALRHIDLEPGGGETKQAKPEKQRTLPRPERKRKKGRAKGAKSQGHPKSPAPQPKRRALRRRKRGQ